MWYTLFSSHIFNTTLSGPSLCFGTGLRNEASSQYGPLAFP
uniref:Uncharacterized protein n=1 Tax=Rhizophora mucronata TaxID=61149 RepID=A0A2P2NLT6_RHIMU